MADERNQPHQNTTKQSPPLEPTKAPAPKSDAERRSDIAAEYEALLSQNQDELTIIKALSAKYSLDQVALGELMAESRKAGAKGPAQPAHPNQMGTAPARGTVQSGKAPESDR
jgi:hypothetical protein